MTSSTVLQPSDLVPANIPSKPRRVRTGCLTCRERHLKCDEAQPDCFNCRKSNRICKRGIRLNFLNVVVKAPPHLLASGEVKVEFQDESREIASEYQGGLGRYAHYDDGGNDRSEGLATTAALDQVVTIRSRKEVSVKSEIEDGAQKDSPKLPSISRRTSRTYLSPPSMISVGSSSFDTVPVLGYPYGQISQTSSSTATIFNSQDIHLVAKSEPTRPAQRSIGHVTSHSVFAAHATVFPALNFKAMAQRQPNSAQFTIPSPGENSQQELEFLGSPEEMHFMQLFADNVAVWMDAFDKDKHFSHVLPHEALKSPMLLNAALACGVRHLARTSTEYHDQASSYFDTASSQLLRSLENPDRETSESAVTAQVLHVYEIMCREPFHRMKHEAGARALIKEHGWNAASTGLAHACFWLNVSMEILNCLVMNWRLTWDPDEWGMQLKLKGRASGAGGGGSDGDCQASDDAGQEEEWLHVILHIVAKVVNYRSQSRVFHQSSPREEKVVEREAEWKQLKRMCDEWMAQCSRTMHPVGYIPAEHADLPSVFPKVWLSCSSALLGRLFYHLSLCLLGQVHPRESSNVSEGIRSMQIHHAHAVCGIIAHIDDQSAAIIAPPCLKVAASALSCFAEQKEVLDIVDRLEGKGWLVGDMAEELKATWGWVSTGKAGLDEEMEGAFGGGEKMQISSSSASCSSSSPSPFTSNSQLRTLPAFNAAGAAVSPKNMSSGPSSSSPSRKKKKITLSAAAFPPSAHGYSHLMTAQSGRTLNPLASADFSLPNHPYQNWYEPPNKENGFGQGFP